MRGDGRFAKASGSELVRVRSSKVDRIRHRPARVDPPKRGTDREPVDCEPTAVTPRGELGRPSVERRTPSERRSPESTPASDQIATSDLNPGIRRESEVVSASELRKEGRTRARWQTSRDVHAR